MKEKKLNEKSKKFINDLMKLYVNVDRLEIEIKDLRKKAEEEVKKSNNT